MPPEDRQPRYILALDALRALAVLGVIVWNDVFNVLYPGVTRCLCELAEQGLGIHHLRNTNLAVYYCHSEYGSS